MALSLALTIMLQTIETKFIRGKDSSLALFWSEISITLLICLFEMFIGIKTTLILSQTGLKDKWPFYLFVWTILLSYVMLQLFQAFLYINSAYFNIT